MTAVEKLAALLLGEGKEIELPVPVEDFVRARAELKFDSLPAGFDGVLVRQVGAVPKVFVEKNTAPTRRRFTLAHELGHLVIPWHLGNIACSPGDLLDSNSIAWRIENEANKFASAVLLPEKWWGDRLDVEETDLGEAIADAAMDAEVSVAAAVMAVGRARGRAVCAALVQDGRVVAAAQSEFWQGPKLGPWCDTAEADLRASSTVMSSYPTGFDRKIIVGSYVAPTVGPRPNVDSKLLLKEILNSVYPADEAEAVARQINGVVGAANSKCPDRTPAGLVSTLCQRFQGRPYLEVLDHPDFEAFLVATAFELSAK